METQRDNSNFMYIARDGHYYKGAFRGEKTTQGILKYYSENENTQWNGWKTKSRISPEMRTQR